MTSLVLTHYRPHRPAGGAPLRNWQNIQALSALGPVDVVTIATDEPPEPVRGVRDWMQFPLTSRTRWDRIKTASAPLRPGIYPGIDLYHSSAAVDWLRRRAAHHRYSCAVIETIALAAYLDDLKAIADRVVFDAHNVEGALQPTLFAAVSGPDVSWPERTKTWVLSRRMLAAERRVIARADLVWACSDVDARLMGELYGRRSGVVVVPNGVDVESYRRQGAPSPDSDWSGLPITMVYPGLFSYTPNEEAALRLIREVLPAVRARGYDARVVLVGRNPTPVLFEAARQFGDVEITGEVPSIVPYLEQPCVVTLPIMAGGGTRLKIVEAFAVGRPVVSTAKGAEGIDANDGEHFFSRESSDRIADAVVECWTQPSLRRTICAAALDLARSRYSWAVAKGQIAGSLGLEPGSGDSAPDDQALPSIVGGLSRV